MIKVIDDFLPIDCFEGGRGEALKANYIDWAGPDGQVYKRISILNSKEELYESVKLAIEVEVRSVVDMLGMAFRLNYKDEPPNQAIHTDLGWGTHALVLYLNDGPSGTAFWTHKPTGKERLVATDLNTYVKVRNDWTDESKWEINNYVEMQANRAVIYESELFHSRYPFEAFGHTPEDGRLILVAFFTPKEK